MFGWGECVRKKVYEFNNTIAIARVCNVVLSFTAYVICGALIFYVVAIDAMIRISRIWQIIFDFHLEFNFSVEH